MQEIVSAPHRIVLSYLACGRTKDEIALSCGGDGFGSSRCWRQVVYGSSRCRRQVVDGAGAVQFFFQWLLPRCSGARRCCRAPRGVVHVVV